MASRKKPEAGNGDGNTTSPSEFAVETLAGDLRDTLLTHVRSMDRPWAKLSEREQADRIAAVQSGATDMVRRALFLIGSRELPAIEVVVGKIGIDKGAVDCKIAAVASADNISAITGARGKVAMLVLADASDYMAERQPVEADPDQPPLFDPDTGEIEDPDEAIRHDRRMAQAQ